MTNVNRLDAGARLGGGDTVRVVLGGAVTGGVARERLILGVLAAAGMAMMGLAITAAVDGDDPGGPRGERAALQRGAASEFLSGAGLRLHVGEATTWLPRPLGECRSAAAGAAPESGGASAMGAGLLAVRRCDRGGE
jgi:hypothetical protein